MGRLALLCTLVALALVGCGDEAPLPTACTQADAADVLHALAAAPGHVALADGTLLSTCIDRAVDDAQLQALGTTFVAAADQLADRLAENPDAAVQLGFLIGAAERGAGATGGVQGELVQRLESSAGFRDGSAERRDAVLEGTAAGRRDG